MIPSLKRSASKDKYWKDKDTSNVMQIVDVRKVTAAWCSPSALGGSCGNGAAPQMSAFSTEQIFLAVATRRQATRHRRC